MVEAVAFAGPRDCEQQNDSSGAAGQALPGGGGTGDVPRSAERAVATSPRAQHGLQGIVSTAPCSRAARTPNLSRHQCHGVCFGAASHPAVPSLHVYRATPEQGHTASLHKPQQMTLSRLNSADKWTSRTAGTAQDVDAYTCKPIEIRCAYAMCFRWLHTELPPGLACRTKGLPESYKRPACVQPTAIILLVR